MTYLTAGIINNPTDNNPTDTIELIREVQGYMKELAKEINAVRAVMKDKFIFLEEIVKANEDTRDDFQMALNDCEIEIKNREDIIKTYRRSISLHYKSLARQLTIEHEEMN